MNEATTRPVAPTGRWLLAAVGLAWIMVALAIASLGLLARAPFVIPLAILGSVAASVLAYGRVPALRAALAGVDLRVPILFNVVRAPIGAAFLVEYANGRLPALFALRGGWGDIVAGALAIVAVVALPATTRARRGIVLAWNALGLLDILSVVATAQYLLFVAHDPLMRAAFPSFGYALLPTLVVPWVVLSHLFAFSRLRRRL
jgi:hypothetical protein